MKNFTSKLANINEGDEYTSLQDILSTRGSWLNEDEIWAVCLEACETLKNLSGSAEKLQKLRIMLETVSFDNQGKVCFTDHESDSDSHYKPPEYDAVGNTLKGHLYSLGLVLYESSVYSMSEIAKAPERSSSLKKLLNSMMESDYTERTDIDGVVSSCNSVFSSLNYKSQNICKHLVEVFSQSENDGVVSPSTSDSPKSSSVSSFGSLQVSSMSLQDLVEKYTTDENSDNKSLSLISPPENFKMPRDADGNPVNSKSAFKGLHTDDGSSLSPVSSSLSPVSSSLSQATSSSTLPEQYNSPATHFAPIVLSGESSTTNKHPGWTDKKTVKTLTKLKKNILRTAQDEARLKGKSEKSKQSSDLPNPAPKSILKPSSREKASTPPLTQAVRPLPRGSDQSTNQIPVPTTAAIMTPPTSVNEPHTPTSVQHQQPVMVGGTHILPQYNTIPFPYMISPNRGTSGQVHLVPMVAMELNSGQPAQYPAQYWSPSQGNVLPHTVVQHTQDLVSSMSSTPIQTVSISSASQITNPTTISSVPIMSQATSSIGNSTNNMPVQTTVQSAISSQTIQQSSVTEKPISAQSNNNNSTATSRQSDTQKITVQAPSVQSEQPATGIRPKAPRHLKKKKPAPSTAAQDSSQVAATSAKQNSLLKKVRKLLKEEFGFDGYMDNSSEDLEMAKFILQMPEVSLEILKEIIVAKYGDLYWSDELLSNIYEVVYGKKPELTPRAPSGAKVIGVHEPSGTSTQARFATSPFRPIPEASLSLAQNLDSTSSNNSSRSLLRPQPVMPVTGRESGFIDVGATSPSTKSLGSLRVRSSSYQDLTSHGLEGNLIRSRSQGNSLDKGADVSPMVKSLTLPNGQVEQVLYVTGKSPSLQQLDDLFNRCAGSAFEQDSDSHSQSSASELRVKGRLHSFIDENWLDEAGSKFSSEYDFSTTSSEAGLTPSAPWKKSCSSIIYASHLNAADTEMNILQDKPENKSVDGLKKKIADITQQLTVHCKNKNKTAKYIRKIIENAANGNNKKGVDYKSMLSSIKSDHLATIEEMSYLSHAKLQLEVLLAEQSSLELPYLYSLTKPTNPLILVRHDQNPEITVVKKHNDITGEVEERLQSGRTYGLIAFLYGRNSLTSGYILQFFYTFRYYAGPSDVLNFIISKYVAASQMTQADLLELKDRVMKRSLDLLMFWFSSFFSVDFIYTKDLTAVMSNFIIEEVMKGDYTKEGECLLRMIDELVSTNEPQHFVDPLPRDEDVPYINDDNPVARKWNSNRTHLTIGSGKNSVQYQKTRAGLKSCASLKRSPSSSISTDSLTKSSTEFSMTDYSVSEIAENLTVIEQEFFQWIHPVNFLDSLGRNINVALADVNRKTQMSETKSLFVHSYPSSLTLKSMIEHGCCVSRWVTAEICSTNPKSQAAVISHFAQVAKICKEIRNYATCIAIRDGLDDFYVKHCPGWGGIPTKFIVELDDLQLKLKTDAEALVKETGSDNMPTIPSPLLFSLHVQQLEQGSFVLANKTDIKWPKLRSLANLIDQIRLFKRFKYDFSSNSNLKSALIQRIEHMSSLDLKTLVATSMNYSQNNNKSKWASVIRKVKDKFN